jgi:AcrR family transcriptional regulator
MAEGSRDTRQRVLDAASELFAERGFHGTKVRDIATRAKVNLASSHYHFGSKETLYLDVLRAQFGALHAVLEARGASRSAEQIAAASRAELLEMLRARITAMLELLVGPPPGLHGTLMLREMCDPSEALPVIVDQLIQPHKREMEQIVARLAPELDAEAVERCVYGIVGQVFFHRTHLPAMLHMLGRNEVPRDFVADTAAHIAEFSLGGIERIVGARRRLRSRRAALPTGRRRSSSPAGRGQVRG